MAGHRRTAAPRSEDGTVHPMSAAGRPARIKDKMLARFEQAATPSERVAVAKDFALAAAVPARRKNPAVADQILHDLARQLLQAGDMLLQQAS